MHTNNDSQLSIASANISLGYGSALPQVTVDPPSIEQTTSILRGLRPRYERHHGVTISESALLAAAQLSTRYITNRHLPDKAIDCLDEAAAQVG